MRHVCRIIICLAFALPCAAAFAQAFPVKPVRLIVGFTPGTSVAIVARLVGQKLAEGWGQPVVVENRPGAGGNIAADAVAKAAPDGHTIILANNSLAISASLYKKLSYDAVRDLAPVTQVSYLTHALVVTPNLPANSVRELIALAKAKPGQLNFGSGGTGNSDHMAGELFKSMAGIDIVHVPYKGGTEAMNDTIGGQVAMYFAGVTASLPFVKSGRLKVLGTSGAKRSVVMPEVPTIAEAGLPGYQVTLWNAFFVPAATPPAVIAKIAADSARVLKLPEVQERLATLGLEIAATPPAETRAYFGAEIGKWSKVVKSIGLHAE